MALLFSQTKDNIVRFELDGAKLAHFLTQVEEIEKSVDMYAHT